MAELKLSVERRELFGKNEAGRIRRSGRIPGILYGDAKEPVPLTIDPKEIEGIMAAGINSIFDLELAGTGQKRPAMIHEVQRHPLHHGLIHVDFVRVNMQKKIHVRVHVKLEGLASGVKNQGGILEHLHREIGLECLPGDIPHDLTIDVSHLNVGQSVRVGDLQLDAGKFRVLDDRDTVIAVVALPAAEKEAAAAPTEAPAAAEPEVIKKGKEKEGEGGAPAEKKGAEKGAEAKPKGEKEKK